MINKFKQVLSLLMIICLIILIAILVSCTTEEAYGPESRWVRISRTPGGTIDFGNRLYPQPFIDQNNNVMFPLIYFDYLFRDGLSYEVNYDTITITKNVLDVITVVSITIGSNILTRNKEEIIMDTFPIKRNEIIYIPLIWVGEALDYRISRDDERASSNWGGWVEFNQFTSIFIYIWNEYKDSSPEGLRFSYIISGEDISDLYDIKARATSDFEEVYALIGRLPQGAYVWTRAIYRVHGYKIPHNIFDEITRRIHESGYRSSWGRWLIDEIPSIITGLSDWSNRSFSENLFSLGEEAIYNSSRQIYRFYNSNRRFLDMFMVRIEINYDGTANVYYKTGNGPSGPHSGGELLRYENTILNKDETQEFLNLLSEIDFWNLPTEIERMGFGGNDVIFEGVKDGEHHIVYRWVPRDEDGDYVYRIENFFRALVEQRFAD